MQSSDSNSARIGMKFVLRNTSASSLSNVKLEVRVEAVEGQDYQLFEGEELPEEPEPVYEITAMRGVRSMMQPETAPLSVDNAGNTPICYVRFGSLLPSEEVGSSDFLVIVPASPGRLCVKFRVLAGELAAPRELERTIDTSGETLALGFEELEKLYGDAIYSRHEDQKV